MTRDYIARVSRETRFIQTRSTAARDVHEKEGAMAVTGPGDWRFKKIP
jgi:hypothetical protein